MKQSGMVGLSGLEPLTSRLSGVCSNHLSYRPRAVPAAATSSHGQPPRGSEQRPRRREQTGAVSPREGATPDRSRTEHPEKKEKRRRRPLSRSALWVGFDAAGMSAVAADPGTSPRIPRPVPKRQPGNPEVFFERRSRSHPSRSPTADLPTAILRKEVIQPQVPLRLPCYDLVPITELIVGACLLTVSLATSDPPRFRGLTGGVYKAQEHIHRSIADLRLLAIPASCRRVAACNPN